MAIKVKKLQLWKKETANKPGALDAVLTPLADAGADLQVVVGYGMHGTDKAAVEVFPVKGRKPGAAAKDAGLAVAATSALLVEGDNRAGLGHAITGAIAGAGIDLSYLVAMVSGKKFSALIGFHNEADAGKAVPLVKKAAAAKRAKASAAKKPAAKKSASKKPPAKKAAAKPAAAKAAAKKPAAGKAAVKKVAAKKPAATKAAARKPAAKAAAAKKAAPAKAKPAAAKAPIRRR